MIYISPDSFWRLPHCEEKAVGWDDEKGSAILSRAQTANSNYHYAMERARSASATFNQMRREIDRVLNENPPTLKTSV